MGKTFITSPGLFAQLSQLEHQILMSDEIKIEPGIPPIPINDIVWCNCDVAWFMNVVVIVPQMV